MVVVKCGKCGRGYQLEAGEKPSDYQCECGGKLTYSESIEGITSNNQLDGIKSWKKFLNDLLKDKLELKTELRLFAVLICSLAFIEMFLGLYALLFLQQYFFLGVIALMMGIVFTFIIILSFRVINKKIYLLHSAVFGLIFLQCWVLSDSMNVSKWYFVLFIPLILGLLKMGIVDKK